MAYWYLGGGNLGIGDKIVDLLDRNGTLAAQARARAMSSVPSAAGPRGAFSQIDPDATVRAATMRTNAQEADYAAKMRAEMARRQLAEDARQFDVGQANTNIRAQQEAQARQAALERSYGMQEREFAAQQDERKQRGLDREEDRTIRKQTAEDVALSRRMTMLNAAIDDTRMARQRAEAVGDAGQAAELLAREQGLIAQRQSLIPSATPAPQAPASAPTASPITPAMEQAFSSGEPVLVPGTDTTPQAGFQSAPAVGAQQIDAEPAQEAASPEADAAPQPPKKTGNAYQDSILQQKYEKAYDVWHRRDIARQQREEAGLRIDLARQQLEATTEARTAKAALDEKETGLDIQRKQRIERDAELKTLAKQIADKDHLGAHAAVQKARERMNLTPDEMRQVLATNVTATEQSDALRDAPEEPNERLAWFQKIGAGLENPDQAKAFIRSGGNVNLMRKFVDRQIKAAQQALKERQAEDMRERVPGHVQAAGKMLEFVSRNNPITAGSNLVADWMDWPSLEASLQTEQRARNAPRVP